MAVYFFGDVNMMNILSFLNRLSCAAVLGLSLLGAAAAQAETYEATATAHPKIVPPGSDIVSFGQTEVDGWIPMRFDVSLPTDFQVTGVRFTLDIKPIGQLIDTDTFHCLDDDGEWYTIFDNFEAYEAGKRVTIQFDVKDLTKIDAALRAGILRCVLQDDTALYGATMQVFGNPASTTTTTTTPTPTPTTTGPTFGVNDPNGETWVIEGAWLNEAYSQGYITIGRSNPPAGSHGTFIFFRQVVSWDGYGTDPSGQFMKAATVTFGPERWVYYP